MTTLICNFQDIVGERINGHATLSAGEIRVGQDAPTVVLSTPSLPEPIIEGVATFQNVEPGRAILQLHWDRKAATLRFTVPNTPETITLSECVEQTLEYTPHVTSHSLGLIEGARDEAVQAVDAEFDEAMGRWFPVETAREGMGLLWDGDGFRWSWLDQFKDTYVDDH